MLSFNNGKKNLIHNLPNRYKVLNDQILWENTLGQFHRVNGPAINNGYYQNGNRHSLDAYSISSNILMFCVNGYYHKINQPSEIYNDYNKEYYYLYGKIYASKGIIQRFYKNNQLHRDDGPSIIYAYGDQFWYINNQIHREDGPAIIYKDGTQKWYIKGLLHREDGPAVIYADGTQRWYINNLLLRDDGPAIIDENGTQYWCVKGVIIRKNSSMWGVTTNIQHT